MATKTYASELRIVVFGKNPATKATLRNCLTGRKQVPSQKVSKTSTSTGEWKRIPVTVVTTPDVFALPELRLRHEMRMCVAHCPPGPNVLLLVVNPTDFTENDRQRLKLIVSLFGANAFKHSIVVVTRGSVATNSAAGEFVKDCRQNQHRLDLSSSNSADGGIDSLMEQMSQIVCNNREHLNCADGSEAEEECTNSPASLTDPNDSSESEVKEERVHSKVSLTNLNSRDRSVVKEQNVHSMASQRYLNFSNRSVVKEQHANSKVSLTNLNSSDRSVVKEQYANSKASPTYLNFSDGSEVNSALSLNLVLCGRFEVGKTSTANVILNNKRSASGSSELVRNQAVVSGRQVSLVELPSFSGKSSEEVMQQAFTCVSLFHPEGVHAFILVMPLDPPTDDDKEELNLIRNILSSRVNDFILVLFTVESDPAQRGIVDFVRSNQQVQEFCQRFKNRYLVFNINDKKHLLHLLDAVEKMKSVTGKGFTKALMARPRLSLAMKVEAKAESSQDHLRMVMVGKTGSGKSAAGNTILGKHYFDSKSCLESVTKVCQKVEGEVDGRRITVVDTPGLFDTKLSNDEVKKELIECINLLAPGPHVFLFILQVGRFTSEERDTVELIKDFFGKKTADFIILLFTRGDDLGQQTLESYIQTDVEGNLQKLMSECGGRCHLFNNRDPTNRSQVSQLMEKIDSVVSKNNGGYYTSEMFQEAEEAIQKEQQRIMKMKEPELQKQKMSLERKYEKKLMEEEQEIERERAEREKALREKEERISKEEEMRKRVEEAVAQAQRKRKYQDEVDQQQWDQKEKDLTLNLRSSGKTATPNEQLRKAREAWEKERKEWWEKQTQEEKKQEQERTRLKQLRVEYEMEKIADQNKREEEDRIRREKEEEFQQSFRSTINLLTRQTEEKARRQAEELNDFKQRYLMDVSVMKEEHGKEVEDMKQQQLKNRHFLISQINTNKAAKKEYLKIKERHNEDMAALQKYLPTQQQIHEMEKMHDREIDEWIQNKMESLKLGKSCTIL